VTKCSPPRADFVWCFLLSLDKIIALTPECIFSGIRITRSCSSKAIADVFDELRHSLDFQTTLNAAGKGLIGKPRSLFIVICLLFLDPSYAIERPGI
jgi:hypothetical protein